MTTSPRPYRHNLPALSPAPRSSPARPTYHAMGNHPVGPLQPTARPSIPFRAGSMHPILGSMKRGGRVKRTGVYKLHKGEQVVPLSSLQGRKY